MAADSQAGPPPRPRRCPVCGRSALPEWRPFCSARCRQVDLGRWLAGDYVVPGTGDAASAEDEPEG
jgi:uncharacterized protein